MLEWLQGLGIDMLQGNLKIIRIIEADGNDADAVHEYIANLIVFHGLILIQSQISNFKFQVSTIYLISQF